jgi:hypothetical protein
MQAEGMTATVSSIHVNGWFGHHDKWSGAQWMLRRLFGRDLDREPTAGSMSATAPTTSPCSSASRTAWAWPTCCALPPAAALAGLAGRRRTWRGLCRGGAGAAGAARHLISALAHASRRRLRQAPRKVAQRASSASSAGFQSPLAVARGRDSRCRAAAAAFHRQVAPADDLTVAPQQRQRVVAAHALRCRRVGLEAVGPAPEGSKRRRSHTMGSKGASSRTRSSSRWRRDAGSRRRATASARRPPAPAAAAACARCSVARRGGPLRRAQPRWLTSMRQAARAAARTWPPPRRPARPVAACGSASAGRWAHRAPHTAARRLRAGPRAAGRGSACRPAAACWRCCCRRTSSCLAVLKACASTSRGCTTPRSRTKSSTACACAQRAAARRAGRARVHQRLRGARQEAVVDEEVLFDRPAAGSAFQVAGAVAGHAVAQRQVLRARRGADGVGLHEAQARNWMACGSVVGAQTARLAVVEQRA